MYTYSAAPATYSAAPPVAYAAPARQPVQYAGRPAAPVAYAAAPPMQYAAPATYAAPTYAAPVQYAAPTYAAPAQYAAPVQYASVAASPQLVVQGYRPTSVQAAWDNHFEAFGKQDLDQIMLDYDETSEARVWNNADAEPHQKFNGTTEIRAMFDNLFRNLPDLATLDAPVVDVDEAGRTVFLVWHCAGCGYNTATDTFVYGPDFKIKRQNIVVTKV